MGDIDGMVERNGYFLIVETKRPNVDINQGQSIAYEQLAKLPNMTVIYIWGELNNPVKLQYAGESTIHIASQDVVHKHFSDWFKRVDALPKYDPNKKEVTDADFYEWFKKLPLERLWKLLRTIQDYMDELTGYIRKDKAA